MPLTEPDLWISHIRLFNSPHVTGANGSGQDFWKALCICPFLHPLVRECHKAPFSACCLPTDFCRYPIAEAKFAFRRVLPLSCAAKSPTGRRQQPRVQGPWVTPTAHHRPQRGSQQPSAGTFCTFPGRKRSQYTLLRPRWGRSVFYAKRRVAPRPS